MRVLLAKPPNPKMKIVIPSMSLGYLASVLKKHNHEIVYLDCMKERFEQAELRQWMMDNGPFDMVGCIVFSGDVSHAKGLFEIAKEFWPHCHTTAGGPHPSSIPIFYLDHAPYLDTCFQGEGEVGLPLLLEYLADSSTHKLEDIPGLVWRSNGKAVANERGVIYELDEIPFPDWSLLRPDKYPDSPHGTFSKRLPVAPIVTTRGCPYPCTFCSVSLTNGTKLRMRSIDNILDEMELLYHEYGVKEIHLEDDNFTLAKKRAMEFCHKLMERKLDIVWAVPNGLRLDTLDVDILKTMEKAGCYSFSIGIESGSPKILEDMRRDVTVEVMEERIRLVAEHTGIRMTGQIIIGYPTETLEDIKETIDFSLRVPIHRADFHNYIPLPGTVSFNELVENKEIDLESFNWDKLVTLDINYSPKGMTHSTVKRMVKTGFFKFYSRPKIIKGLLREINSWNQLKTVFTKTLQTFTY